MGNTKALLPVPPNKNPLVLHIAERLGPLANMPILVVANDPAICSVIDGQENLEYLPDAHPETGPLSGLLTVLPLCEEWVMVVACDMPLVNPAVFGLLVDIANRGASQCDAIVPWANGRPQPLHALYHHRALSHLQNYFNHGERSISRLLPRLNVHIVPEEKLLSIDQSLTSFVNVNTPEEWIAIQRQLIDSSIH